MTVCLAALCTAEASDGGAGPAAVVAADRMVTLGSFIEFEHANPKMATPSSSSIVMIAGDTLVGTRLAKDVADSFNGTASSTHAIAQAIAEQYAQVRQNVIAQQLLAPRGLNLATYYGSHQSLNPQIVMMLDQTMANWNLGVELLLAGVDGFGAHIFSIMNPGGAELQHDVIGYSAVGSGAIHAIQALIGFGHHAKVPLHETVFRAYVAKRRAEVAPGVGKDTDLAIISQTSTSFMSEDQLKTLAAAYDIYENSNKQELQKQLEKLKIDLAESDPDEPATS